MVAVAVLALVAILLLGGRGGGTERTMRKGLRGLRGRDTTLESKGYSTLGDADRIPRMRESMEGVIEEDEEDAIPMREREQEFLSDKKGYDLDTADAGGEEPEPLEEHAKRKKVKSLIQKDREGTTLGEK